jgi:CheY-like chemotaxis protein
VILIVDDYHDGAEALCRLLGKRGYPCHWVGSGPDALAYIRAHPPEQPLLVILDDMMPQMTGVDLLRAIREDPKISQTTVLMYSAGFDVEHRATALTLGAAAWILKGGVGGAALDAVINQVGEWYEKVGGVPLASEDAPRRAQPEA